MKLQTINVYEKTKERLRKLKLCKRDSFDAVINRELDELELRR